MNASTEDLFGDIISVYTRAQALEDGELVDVSTTAREAGFRFPVAVSRALWADIERIPASSCWQDVDGRLWDVLWMGARAARRATGDRLLYHLIMHVGRQSNYMVKMIIGPGDHGEPVITLMLPSES